MRLLREDGIALIVALMAMMLMAALGITLILTTASEAMIAGNFRNAQEGFYAAEAALARAIGDLPAVPDWNRLLDGSGQSAYVDGSPGGLRTLPDGSTIDLAQVVNLANCWKDTICSASDLTSNTAGDRPWGANNPVWRLYAYNRLDQMVPAGTIDSSYYVVVLVGDDPSETDGNPLLDGASAPANPGSNVLLVRAEAFGPRGAHRVVEATVARYEIAGPERELRGPAGVRILSWREVR